MDKIDTQGLSGPSIKGCTDNVYPHDENGEPILPRAVIKPRRIHTPEVVKELVVVTVNVFCVLLTISRVSSIAFPEEISKKTSSRI